MALFRIGGSPEPLQAVHGQGVYARTPQMSDFPQWCALRSASRDFLTPWEPVWPADDLTRSAFRRRIKRQEEEMARDETYPFFVFRADDDLLVGGLTLGHIRRGVAQTGTLGYWMGERYAGQGLMSAAVRSIARFGFSNLALHRIEAACLPHNEASTRLLERCGFQREGYARAYLRINGLWQDHILFALLDSDQILPAEPRPA